MDILFSAASEALTLTAIMYIATGVIIGVIVGAIPGLSGAIAVALCVPLTFYMSATAAIGFLIGINKGGTFGGSIASILINTPGAPESAATTFDGYPLAKRGQGMRALKTSLYASFFGDTFSALCLIAFSIPLASVALKLAPADLCAIIVFSLVLVSGLETDNLAKGLISCCLGMLVACIGQDTYGEQRFIFFGIYELSVGVSLVGLSIGTLALSEVLFQSQKHLIGQQSAAGASLAADKKDKRLNWHEFKKLIPTCIRSSAIGSVIGALPGLGATMAAFMGYGLAKKMSKHPEEFGKGSLEGIAAPEAANNAVFGSNLIPVLTLGIPGNVSAAIYMGALIMHGITPGPLLFEQEPKLIYGIYLMVLIAGFVNLVVSRAGMGLFFRALSLRRTVLMPLVMFLCLCGAYLGDMSVFAVGIMLVMALLGFFMRLFNYSFVTFLIGFVLAPAFETYLQQSLIIFDDNFWLFFTRPVPVLCALGSLYIIYRALRRGPSSVPVGDPDVS